VRPSAKPAEPRELRGIVAAVGRTPSGKLIVTLDSGQVWVQTDVASSEAVKPGADVRIEKAMLGSFLLLAPDRSAIRVRRVQ
jgi:hypothetical protein